MEKNFGYTFSILFFIIAFYPTFYGSNILLWSLFLSFLIILFTIFFPSIFYYPSRIWNKFGIYLNKFISPIVITIIYIISIIPIGIFIRLIRVDLLGQKLRKKNKSYWIDRSKVKSSMKDQF